MKTANDTKIKLSLNEMANTRNKWVVIAVDETQFWSDDLKKKAKKIEGVYLINLRMPTHLCELAVSYPAIHLRNFVPDISCFENDCDDDLSDIEMQKDDEIRYFSGYSVFEAKKTYKSGKEEEIVDYESANPSYC